MAKASKEEQRKAPILRFKGFTDDWEQRQLSNVIKLMGGNAFKGSSAVKEGIPWLKITNVGKNGINWDTQFYLPFSFWDKWPNYQLFSGDYVMALTRPVLDHTLKIGKMDRKALLNQRVSKLEFSFDKEFTFQLLQRKKTVIEIEKELAGSDPPNLGSKNLKNIKIFLSINPDEQKRIGLLFRCLDNLLALYERKVKLFSKVKKYFLDNLFAEKKYPNLRFKGFTDAWERRNFGEVIIWSKGSGFSKDDLNSHGNGVPAVHYADLYKFSAVQQRVIHWVTSDKGIKIPSNSLLFPMSDVTPNGLARTSTILQTNVRAGGDILIAKLNKDILSTFMSYQINKNKKQILPLITGITVRHINASSLNSLKILIPNKTEQICISSILEKIDFLITLYEDKQQHLIKIKNTLLNTMFI